MKNIYNKRKFIGEQLVHVCKKHRISKYMLAKEIGLSSTTVNKIFTGAEGYNIDNLLHIIQFLETKDIYICVNLEILPTE